MRGRLTIVFAAAVMLALPPSGAAAEETGWTPVIPAIVHQGSASIAVSALAAPAPADVWSVVSAWGDGPQQLIGHWQGSGWSLTPAPSLPDFEYSLIAMDAVSASGIWAVGYGNAVPTGIPAATDAVITHYDGASWSSSRLRGVAPWSSWFLSDVDMLSATDGWAVGVRVGPMSLRLEALQALVLRWQNGQWSEVPVPHFTAGDAKLESVHARSANDVWAVGFQGKTSLVMHFDGVQWRRVGVPHGGSAGAENLLRAVASTPGGDVWAAGSACVWVDPGFASCEPLVLRLSGGVWRVVPSAGNRGTHIIDIAVRSADDIWLAGYHAPAGEQESNHVEHWDGQRFTTSLAGTAGATGFTAASSLASALQSIVVIPGTGELWVTGWLQTETYDIEAQVLRHG